MDISDRLKNQEQFDMNVEQRRIAKKVMMYEMQAKEDNSKISKDMKDKMKNEIKKRTEVLKERFGLKNKKKHLK